jgi:hypothetical protein
MFCSYSPRRARGGWAEKSRALITSVKVGLPERLHPCIYRTHRSVRLYTPLLCVHIHIHMHMHMCMLHAHAQVSADFKPLLYGVTD